MGETNLKCPKCGITIKADEDKDSVYCPFCDNTFKLEVKKEIYVNNVKVENNNTVKKEKNKSRTRLADKRIYNSTNKDFDDEGSATRTFMVRPNDLEELVDEYSVFKYEITKKSVLPNGLLSVELKRPKSKNTKTIIKLEQNYEKLMRELEDTESYTVESDKGFLFMIITLLLTGMGMLGGGIYMVVLNASAIEYGMVFIITALFLIPGIVCLISYIKKHKSLINLKKRLEEQYIRDIEKVQEIIEQAEGLD